MFAQKGILFSSPRLTPVRQAAGLSNGVKCDICGSSSFYNLYKKIDSGIEAFILKCLDCNLVFIYPQTTKDKKLNVFYQGEVAPRDFDLRRFDEKARRLRLPLARLILRECYGYSKLEQERSNIWKKITAYFLKHFFIKDIIPFRGQGRILDIGCGSGLYLALLKEIGWETYGVEINSSTCEYARKLGINVFCGELLDAHFPSEFFDVIRMIQVLEHVSSPTQMFGEITRILKPGGIIYLETPNQNSLAFRCFKEKWLGIGGHIYAFSYPSLKFICQKAGLRIRKIRYKSSKGIVVDSLKYLWQSILTVPLPVWISKNKIVQKVVVNPLRFFLSLFCMADNLVVEIVK